MCPYAIIKLYKFFISNRFFFIENDKIEKGTLLNGTNSNLDPFLNHLVKCGVEFFEKLELSQILCCWPHDEEDESIDLVVEHEDDVLVEED